MKKGLFILAALVMLVAPVCAENTLPPGILSLCAEKYPDYQVVSPEGWEAQSVFVLQKGDQNILCMAELQKDGRYAPNGDYAFTLEAPGALKTGEVPFLFLDTDGATLFYSYWEGEVKTEYSATRSADGTWGSVRAIVYDGLEQWTVGVHDGKWHCQYWLVDENDNILEWIDYPAWPVTEEYEQSLCLDAFEIGSLPLTPEQAAVCFANIGIE